MSHTCIAQRKLCHLAVMLQPHTHSHMLLPAANAGAAV